MTLRNTLENATPDQLRAMEWAFVHSALVKAQRMIEADHGRATWLDGAIDIAAEGMVVRDAKAAAPAEKEGPSLPRLRAVAKAAGWDEYVAANKHTSYWADADGNTVVWGNLAGWSAIYSAPGESRKVMTNCRTMPEALEVALKAAGLLEAEVPPVLTLERLTSIANLARWWRDDEKKEWRTLYGGTAMVWREEGGWWAWTGAAPSRNNPDERTALEIALRAARLLP